MTSTTSTSRLTVAVNSTEWRNLCARGAIRMQANRAVRLPEDPEMGDYARMFAAAPTTKIDSSIDLLVLDLSDRWVEAAEVHRANPDVRILRLEEVVAHHLVSDEHLAYYREEGAKVSVEISDAGYEAPWRQWVVNEMARAAEECASTLVERFTGQPPTTETTVGGDTWATVAAAVISGSTERLADPSTKALLRSALSIDDAAAAVRGTEAYLIACCVEWIDVQVGIDAFEARPSGAVLRSLVADSRHRDIATPASVSPETDAAFDLLEACYPTAFNVELTARSIPPLVTVLAEARTTTPAPHMAAATLLAVARREPSAMPLAAVITAAAIGPEFARQLVRSSNRDLMLLSSRHR